MAAGQADAPAYSQPSGRGRLALGLVLAGVAVYAVVFTARTVAAYTSGSTLFDLATYQQGFWNALGWPPFFYSTEGEMSRFGRHFSPIFYLILPLFWLYPQPPTLLAVHSLAIGAGAIPVFLLARRYLGQTAGVLFALAYLLSPATQDINVQNDFHEIAFALPALLWLFYAGLTGRRWQFVIALVLALAAREEVAVTTAAFGVYLLFARSHLAIGRANPRPAAHPSLTARLREWLRRPLAPEAALGRLGLAVSTGWLVVVVFIAMPLLNAGRVFPVPEGFEHLGASPLEILRAMLAHPGVVVRDVLSTPKLTYVGWLLASLGFAPLLAPPLALVSAPALLEILTSRYPPHFYVFERYTAPVLPALLIAAILGASRVTNAFAALKRRPYLLALVVLAGTLVSQAQLRKFPTEFRFAPDPHSAVALAVASRIPAETSVAVADHRLLAHLASRRSLYVLGPDSPRADYVLFDRGRAPITQYSPAELRRAEARMIGDPNYRGVTCESGVVLLARQSALQRDGSLSPPPAPAGSALATFGESIQLEAVAASGPTADRVTIRLRWRALGRGYPDYQVFVHLLDASGQIVGQDDSGPAAGLCPTSAWATGLVVGDDHLVALQRPPATVTTIRVGLYELATLARLPRTDVGAGDRRDYVDVPFAPAP